MFRKPKYTAIRECVAFLDQKPLTADRRRRWRDAIASRPSSACPLQTHEMLFDAHYNAFRVLGSVPRRGIYDNMRTAVDQVGHGKARQVNARFLATASHYLFDAEFCNPAAGWKKGQVEKNVQDARHRLWQPMEFNVESVRGRTRPAGFLKPPSVQPSRSGASPWRSARKRAP